MLRILWVMRIESYADGPIRSDLVRRAHLGLVTGRQVVQVSAVLDRRDLLVFLHVSVLHV